jgi:hypothetical protein
MIRDNRLITGQVQGTAMTVKRDDWSTTGLDESEIEDAIGFHLTVDDVREWRPFHPLEIYWAKKHGLSVEEARRWMQQGVPIRDAIRARMMELTAEEIHHWRSHGFTAADACEAKETGVTIQEVMAWREAGFVVPDALQLIRHGWTLTEAIVARNRHLDPAGAVGRKG